MAFAITNGNFASASTWDTGIVPTSIEDVYANGYTVQMNISATVSSLRNDVSDYYLPNTSVPQMTSPTSPSGIVTANSQVTGGEAWKAFDRNTSTFWQSTAGSLPSTISYQFPTTKIIKRYMWRASTTGTTAPRNFTFEGSNDNTTWITLDTQTAINVGSNNVFVSGLLANTTAYLYYRINITSINGGAATIIAEIEMTESSSLINGQIAGGTFEISTPNLTINSTSLNPSLTGLIIVSSSSGTTTLNISNSFTGLSISNSSVINYSGNCNLTINCPNITGVRTSGAGVGNSYCISKSSNGLLTFNGNVNGGAGNGGTGLTAIISSNGDIVIVGNVAASPTGNTNACYGVNQTNGKLTVIGNVVGNGSSTATGFAILSTSSSNLEITGNVTGGGIAAAISKSSGSIIVTGNIIGSNLPGIIGTPTSITVVGDITGSLASGINITNNGSIDTTGNITAGTASPGISTVGLVKIVGILNNNSRYMAVFAPQVTLESTATSWRFQTFAGPDRVLYTSGAALGQPATNDVRFGVVFGATSEFTGTLRVPSPSNVLKGVLTDNTTGTLIMAPKDFWDYQTSGLTASGSIGERLKNASTVATTGAQIASYNI